MKITNIDRAVAKRLHAEFNAAIKASDALQALGAKYGLTVEPQNASFDGASMTFKVKLAVPIGDAPVRSDLVTIAAMAGFDARGTSKDGVYKVTGYSRGKKPWKMARADGTEPQRYWSAPDAWMLMHFPPAPEGSRPVITEAFDLIQPAPKG